MSKVIRDCIGFALVHSVIGLENSRHPLNQSEEKLNYMMVDFFVLNICLARRYEL